MAHDIHAVGAAAAPKITSETMNPLDKSKKTFDDGMGLSWNLLLTEMTHQNPMDPMKPGEMMGRIQGITQTEQLFMIKSGLGDLKQELQTLQALNAGHIKGKQVEVPGDSFTIEGYNLDVRMPEDARVAYIQIMNSDEDVVGQVNCQLDDLKPGLRRMTFNGADNSGKPLVDGEYTYKLVAMVGESGEKKEFDAQKLSIANKPLKLAYNLEKDVPTGGDHPVPYLEVRNEKGAMVRQVPLSSNAGRKDLDLDAVDLRGMALSPGRYKLKTIALDKNMNQIPAELSLVGTVDAITREEGMNMLSVYGRKVPMQKLMGMI